MRSDRCHYDKIVADFPGTPAAAEAAVRVKVLGAKKE
jgi:hypothetical protein